MRWQASLWSFVLVAACAAGPTPHVTGPVPAGTPIQVAGERARFPTATPSGQSVAADGAGGLYLAVGDPDNGARGAAVVALGPDGTPRWRVPFDGRVDGVIALAGGGVLVGVAAAGDEELRVLDRAGRPGPRATFRALLGSPCRFANGSWLAREGDDVIARVGCPALLDVQIAPDLTRATRRAMDAYAPVYAPAWSEPASPDATLVHGGQRIVLARGHDGTREWPRLAPLPGGDVVAGLTARGPGDDPARPGASGPWLQRLGRTPWTADLAPPESPDPAYLDAVAVEPTSRAVLALVDYGRDGRVLDTVLPATGPRRRLHPALSTLARDLAVVELDADRGEPRSLTVLRAVAPWFAAPYERNQLALTATGGLLAIASDRAIVVFPRHGAASAPGTVPPIAAPPPAPPMPPAPDAVTPLVTRWESLCAPRWKHQRNAPCRISAVALGRDGTVAAGGGYYDANQLDDVRLPKAAFETGLLAVYDPGGELRWHKTLGVSWHNEITHVLVRDDGAVVVIGYHGNAFAIDGVRLPDRVVPVNEDFRAVTGFVAVFDRDGKLEVLEDLDALAYGEPSTAFERACDGDLAAAGAPGDAWVLARCGREAFRIRLHGRSFERPESLGPLGNLPAIWTIDPAGGAVAAVTTDQVSLVRFDGTRATEQPLVRGPATRALTAGAWLATSNLVGSSARLTIAGLPGNPVARELAMTRGVSISALAVDDAGRPLVAVRYDQPITLGGASLAPEAWHGQPRGLAIVRLARDGRTIDRIFVPPAPSRCSRLSHGDITALAARGDRIALTFSFGIESACATDEPSTVIVLEPHPSSTRSSTNARTRDGT